ASGDRVTHEHPQRLVDPKRFDRFTPVSPHLQLLIEQQKRSCQIVLLFLVILQIQNHEVLAVPVAIKIAVGIIEQNAPRVSVAHYFVIADRLLERRGIFERKTASGQLVSPRKPCTIAASACATVTFIDQNKVAPLKRLRGARSLYVHLTTLVHVPHPATST